MADFPTERPRNKETITNWLRRIFRRPVTAMARACIRFGITPNVITFLGLLLATIPAVLAARGEFLRAGIIYVLTMPFDALDGAIARESGRVSRLGAMLDSTFDRYAEALLLAALGYRLSLDGNHLGVVLAFAALFGALMVSYTRARSEGLKVENKVGLLTRVERTAITALGLLTGQVVIALWVLAIGTQITVIQRMWRMYQATRAD